MIRLLKKNRGQSTLEYAILIVVVIMALIGIQAYLKRGIQGRMRDSSDQIGEQFSAEFSETNVTTKSLARVNETQDPWSTKQTYKEQWTQRSGNETIGNYQEEYWVQ